MSKKDVKHKVINPPNLIFKQFFSHIFYTESGIFYF